MKIPNDCLLGNCKNYTRLLLPIFIKTFYRIGTKNIVVAYFKIHYAYLNTEFSACSSFTLFWCLCDIYGWMDLLLSLTVKNMLRYSLSILAQYKLKNGSIKRTNSVASCEKILFRRLEYESDDAKSYLCPMNLTVRYRPDGHLLIKSFMK